MPKNVTICVPCFNNEATLASTLKSILNQNYDSFDVLLIDNHSTDNSVNIAARIAATDVRLKIIQNDRNLGLEGNLTRCIEASPSAYTSIWHSDDIYSSDMLLEQMKALAQNPELTAVFAHGSEIDNNGKELHQRYLPAEWKSKNIVKLDSRALTHITLRYGNVVNCPTLTARSEILKNKIKSFNYSEFRSSADLDAWFRLAEVGPIAVVTQPLFKYRISQASFSVREVKKRTTQHDLFLVLRNQIEKGRSYLQKEDFDHYEFLKMKDLALRAWNWRSSKIGDDPLDKSNINWFALLSSLPKSRFHLKFGVIAIIIFILRRTGF